MPGEVPLRRSLLLRLLAVSALVGVCSVAATAWLVIRTTAVAIQQEQGQALADDARVYDALLGYAASHPDWDSVAGTVASLARLTGHRIVLTTRDHAPVGDSAPDPGRPYEPPAKPTAVIDPLAVDPELLPGSAPDRIDPRAVGPFRLPPGERARLRTAAERSAACLRTTLHIDAQVVEGPSGRPRTDSANGPLTPGVRCAAEELAGPTPTEAEALAALNRLVDTCLARGRAPGVRLALDGSWTPRDPRATTDPSLVTSCVDRSRTEQLTPYVAPAALLYVSSPGRSATTFFDLSAGNRARIAGGAALVLLVTFAVTTLAGVRLVRPLRALTDAAQRMERGDASARVRVTGGDEIGRLALAFNSMSRRREQLEAARTAMVSDVAHELRTPLSNIRGWLEAAQDEVVPHDDVLLASLHEEALLLQHLIDDLRDLSAADAGELRIRTERTEVAELLAQTAAAHRGGADGAGVSLVVSAPDGLELEADPVRLRQAVGNLLTNAVRHTPPGGSVTLRSRREGDVVLIEVADTGTGIGPGELPQVFDRFWRAEKSRSRRTGGSGLGLSIVRKLAEAHGGSVTAESTVGAGSVFTLRFPADAGVPTGRPRPPTGGDPAGG
ncbi:ATP-binding protein [Streptomyces sp. NBC_01267]|uniref:sensor histidine kinase n=1 Tax=unclassified Streptomyces TaxID=2593676 RepID=UPI00202584D0|nr:MULTISPECIES: ATP-binding protein [unclassified Streptomyces]WSV55972.1 ATP-binding protein [Streptomyces sp. NBC_01014]